MRRILLIASLLAMLMLAAVPALAQHNDREERMEERFEERFEDEGFFFFDDFDFDDDFDDGSGFGEVEQDAESGDVDQSFTVTGEGDNSNQCVGIQGVANTGNAQNLTDVVQYGSAADDFEFEDSGASIEVSPEASTTCEQQVNQAASATG